MELEKGNEKNTGKDMAQGLEHSSWHYGTDDSDDSNEKDNSYLSSQFKYLDACS